MPASQYSKKRDFKKTPEPKFSEKPKEKISSKKYIIHEHHASHLHWDLRLEIDGVLKSWAVPKEPPKTKGTKRLAIQVEDHPLSYADFEGEIPEGNYGAGKVEIWDSGTYELLKKTPKEIEIEIHGKKLKGKYVLIKTNYQGNKKSWLFFRI